MADRPFLQSLSDAADGMARAVREQRNFRIHLIIAAVAIALAAYLRFAAWRWAVLAVTIGTVMCAELLNTALEYALDAFAPQRSDSARSAKHAAAAAVLVASIAALAVGAWLYGSALAQR